MASLDGNANGAPANDVNKDAADEMISKVSGVKQQADVPQSQIYDVPADVPSTGLDFEGTTLVVTHDDGTVERVENGDQLYSHYELDGVLTEFPWDYIGPGAGGNESSGGNFVVDPGEIDPGLPIVPLLGPTELAFGLPEQEEIFLLEGTEPEIGEVDNTRVDEDGFRFANVDVPLPTEFDGDENLTDTGNITVNYKSDVPGDLDAALVLDDLDSYDGQLQTLDGHDVVFALESGDLVGRSAGDNSEVIRISLQPGPDDLGAGFFTYTYEVTLSQPVEHPSNDTEDILTLVGIQFTATDEDGDSVSGTTDVEIIDDVPHAMNDCFVQMGEQDEKYPEKGPQQNLLPPDWMNGEGEAVSGNVLDDNGFGEDVFSADGEGSPITTLVANSLSGTGNLTFNNDGSFEYEPGAGEEGDVTFQYYIMDDDGDRSTATVTIKLQDDSEPSIDAIGTSVDEDGLGDANSDDGLGTEFNHGGSATNTGTIDVAYGNDIPADLDAAIVFNDLAAYDTELTSGGDPVIFAVEGGTGDLVGTIDGGGTEVIRISITNSTNNGFGNVEYEYTVTLSEEVDQPGNDNEDSVVLNGIQFTVTDGDDGDMVTGTVDITVYDDVPEAEDDDFTQGTENATISGNVLDDNGNGADVVGADSPGTVSFVGGSLVGSGTLTVNADGSFDYEPGAGEEGTVTFDYTLTDADGDKSTATVTIELEDDSEPEVEAGSVTVDEDGFAFANVDEPTGLETDSTESLSATGTVFVDYGNDLPADIDAAFALDDLGSYDGQLVTLDGDDVVFALEGGDLVGRSAGDNSEVIRISVTDSTDNGDGSVDYEYTVTLAQPVQHPTNDNEDSLVLSGIQFTATDGDDGDTTTGTFSVTVVDDVPTAVADTINTPEDTEVTVDVLDNDIIGADQPGVLTGASLSDSASGTISFDTATGEVSYTPAAGFEGDATITYTIEDADGDEDTGTLTVTVGPDSEPEETSPNAVVDEDGFGNANEDEPTGLETDSTESLTDVQTIVVDYGNDVPANPSAAFTLDDLGSYDGQLVTLDGDDVEFAIEGGDLVGRSAGDNSEVIRIAITNVTDNGDGTVDYEYTVTLGQPVQHPTNDNEDSDVLSSIQFTATDSDGDSVTGTFSVTVVDDVPTAVDDGSTSTQDVTPVAVDVLANDISGADDPIVLTGASVVGGTATGTVSINTATGEVTFTAAVGFDGTATVNYTIEDADGDEDTASFTVNVGDTAPTSSETDTSVDEDGLGDANADEPTSEEQDWGGSATNTGTITVDYGPDVPGDLDAAIVLNDLPGYDAELTSGGQTVVFALSGGDLVGTIDAGATEVIRISIDATPTDNGGGEFEYTYTVTLSEAVDQPLNDDEDSIVLDDIQYTATDSDGSTVSGTFDITIYDDVPTAVDDGSTSTADVSPVSVDVLANDISGADDPIVLTGASVVGGTATGSVSINTATGEVTFTAAAGFSGTATVNYTMEDADGDEDTASFTVNVSDETPEVQATNTSVDEDGLGDANADGGLGTEVNHGGSATDTGTISVEYGVDVPANLANAITLDDLGAYDSELTSGGQTVVFALSGGDLVGTIDAGATEIIRISITNVTDNGGGSVDYEYTVTLSQEVDQPGNDSEDSIVLDDIQYTVTDSDGSTQSGTFDVTVYDDVPEAINDGSHNTNDTDLVTVEVVSNDVVGADGPLTLLSASVAGGTATGSTSINTATGEVTFMAAAGFSGTATVNYTIEDADGDDSSASFTVNVSDSTPSAQDTNTQVDEDGLGDANADSGLGTEVDYGGSATDQGTITIDYDNDVPADLDAALVLSVAGLNGQLTSGGDPVVFAIEGGTGDVVGTIDGGATEVIRIHVENTPTDNGGGEYEYTYTVTLSEAVDQAGDNTEDATDLLSVGYTATDSDGSFVSDSFDVNVIGDDVPNLLDGATLTIVNQMPSTGSAELLFSPGADGSGGIIFLGTDNTPLEDTEGNPILSNGDPVLLSGFGTSTLTGYIDEDNSGTFNAGDTEVLTVVLDEGSITWNAMIDVVLDNGSATNFDLVSGIVGGNNDTQSVGANDGSNNDDNIDLMLQALGGSVNTSNGRIGVGGGQSIANGELVKIEFVVNAVETADPLDDTGFNWDAMFATNAFRQEVNRVSGSQSNGANFTVQALNVVDPGDDEITDDLPGGAGSNLDTLVEITDAQLYDANDVLIFDLGAGLYDSVVDNLDGTFTYTVAGTDSDGTGYSVTVIVDTNASSYQVSFTGVLEGWEYAIQADDTFESVAVAGDAGGFNFTLGALSLGEANDGEPFSIEFDIEGTDGDGDSITDTIQVDVLPAGSELPEAQPSIESFSILGGGEGESSGGGLDGSGLEGGGTGSGEGPTGFDANFFGEESGAELNLLSDLMDQFADGSSLNAFVPANINLSEGSVDTSFKAEAPVLGELHVVHGLELDPINSGFQDTPGDSLGGGFSLDQMVDQAGTDLSSLVGSESQVVGLTTVNTEPLESAAFGANVALQNMDVLNYDLAQ